MPQYRRWRADRTAGVGAEGAVAERRRHRGRRPARRAAGIALERPRIAHRAVVTGGRGAAVGELVEVQLAEHDGASRVQSPRHFRVLRRDAVVVDAAGRGRAYAGGVDVVLERDRHPVQRAAGRGGRQCVERFGARQRRLAADGDERVQLRVVGGDAIEARRHEFSGRHLARPDEFGRLGERQPREVRGRGRPLGGRSDGRARDGGTGDKRRGKGPAGQRGHDAHLSTVSCVRISSDVW